MKLIRLLAFAIAFLSLCFAGVAIALDQQIILPVMPLILGGALIALASAGRACTRRRKNIVAFSWLLFTAAAGVTLYLLFARGEHPGFLAAPALLLLIGALAAMRALYLCTQRRRYGIASYYDY